MFKGKFEDIVLPKEGFLRGPFGSALKKSLFVPKSNNTYKVYEQGVVLQQDKNVGEYYISKEYFEESLQRFEVKTGDFLVSCSGVNYGAIYQLKGEIEKGVINQALLRIRLNNEIIDDNYFLYYFKAYIVKKIVGGTGDSTIPNFPPMSVIKNIEIELPDIEEQRKIGEMLASIDNKIDNNNAINFELESMAKTIYDYWFLQFEFPNKEGKPYKSSGGKMVWNEELKREIPEKWNARQIKDFASMSRGISYTAKDITDEGIPIISLASISRDGDYIPEGIKFYNGIIPDNKKLNKYDLVMCNTDMTQQKEVIARCIMIPDIFNDYLTHTHHITKVELDNAYLKSYFRSTTQSNWFHEYVKGFSSGTNVLV